MSVTGIAYRNTAVNYPQQGRVINNGMPEGIEEACAYAESTVVQEVAPTFVEPETDPLKVGARDISYEETQAYNAYMAKQDYLKVEDIASSGASTEEGNTTKYLDGEKIQDMSEHMHLTSGILGFGCLEDGMNYTAKYAADSTPDNPIVEVHMTDEAGKTRMVRVKVNEVDTGNATELEMFAFLSHSDAQKKTGSGKLMESYQELIYRAANSASGDLTSKNQQDFRSWKRDWRGMTLTMTDFKESALQHIASQRAAADDGVPYSYLAKDGIIDYKGVIFVCDTEHKSLCLGDMSDPGKCLHIPLSGGGSLVVNRDNLGDLAKAISMFSPEDVNLILRAIAEDAKIQQMKQQIDDETSGLDIAENTGETKAEEEGSETSYVDTLTVGESKKEKENVY